MKKVVKFTLEDGKLTKEIDDSVSHSDLAATAGALLLDVSRRAGFPVAILAIEAISLILKSHWKSP